MDKFERRCEECGSLQTYIRQSKRERVCRSCGHVGKLTKKKGVEDEKEKIKRT